VAFCRRRGSEFCRWTGTKRFFRRGVDLMCLICRNNYYGGDSASLNLDSLWKKFGKDGEANEENLGRSRDYAVDLCPKFIMAGGIF